MIVIEAIVTSLFIWMAFVPLFISVNHARKDQIPAAFYWLTLSAFVLALRYIDVAEVLF